MALFFVVLATSFPICCTVLYEYFFCRLLFQFLSHFLLAGHPNMSAVRLLPPLLKNLRLNALCLNYGRIYPSRLWSQTHRKCYPHNGKVCEGSTHLAICFQRSACICFQRLWRGWLSWVCLWRLLRNSIICSCVTKSYGFELLTLPSVALFFWLKMD